MEAQRGLHRACAVSPGRAAAAAATTLPPKLLDGSPSLRDSAYSVHESTANALLQLRGGHSSRICSQVPTTATMAGPDRSVGPRDVARALGKRSFVLRAVVAEFIGMTLFGRCRDQ